MHQLKLARKIGFKIPKTIITNIPQEALNFYRLMKGKIITKSIGDGFVRTEDKMLHTYTTRVKEHMDFGLIRNCPTLFQEEVLKMNELRITIVGRKIFAVEIDSQKYKASSLDWRKAVYKFDKIPHRVVELPVRLKQKLLLLLDHYGLNFGAIDMAKTPEGEYVFFELNPAGQFLWLEDLTGLPLASEMAKFLMGR